MRPPCLCSSSYPCWLKGAQLQATPPNSSPRHQETSPRIWCSPHQHLSYSLVKGVRWERAFSKELNFLISCVKSFNIPTSLNLSLTHYSVKTMLVNSTLFTVSHRCVEASRSPPSRVSGLDPSDLARTSVLSYGKVFHYHKLSPVQLCISSPIQPPPPHLLKPLQVPSWCLSAPIWQILWVCHFLPEHGWLFALL